ncbi:uncharacterized protein JCM6883_004536 [Sporobolomyces salmoneus]|uniref:uncharacterized protein n=1 Tax=Sporobolomyces salmoneus TaxID=183962 RepID=UPI0031713A89
MSIAPLDLIPGDSLGPFQLGSLLFNVLNHIRSYRQAYPSAKLLWDDENPSTAPIHLILSQPPLHLTFSSLSQRLSRIEVNPTSFLSASRPRSSDSSAGNWVSYRGKLLRDDDRNRDREEKEDVVRTVRRVLGPTYGSSSSTTTTTGGQERKEEEKEMLCYPGVALGVTEKGSKLNRIILTPLPSNDDESSSAVPVDQAWLHPKLPDSPLIARGDLQIAEISLDSTTRTPLSVTLHFHSPPPLASSRQDTRELNDERIQPVKLVIGETTSEDILCDLGSAVRSFWKEDDRMTIHTHPSYSSVDPSFTLNPYFLSYPHLALTLLLQPRSGSTSQVLEKIILHSNLPGQINFGRTSRANWRIVYQNDHDQRGIQEEGVGGVGGEEKFERIKEFIKNKNGTTNSVGLKEEDTTMKTTTTTLLIPVPSTSESSNSKKNKKNKSKPSGPVLKEVDLLSSSPLDSSPSTSPGHLGRTPSPLRNESLPSDSTTIGAQESESEEREREREEEDEKPMILDRTASAAENDLTGGSGGGGGTKGRTTEIHGFPGIAFEVTKSRDVETVWLF